MVTARRRIGHGRDHRWKRVLDSWPTGGEQHNDGQAPPGKVLLVLEVLVPLLEAERLNDRHRALARSEVTISELIETMLTDYFARDREQVSVQIERDATLQADRVRLTLLLKNLIASSLRYANRAQGSVEIRVSADTDRLTIAVQDHGPGLDAQQAESLGEPFFRSDGSRARDTGGTGLGLYLARLVAEAHGGSLAVDPTWQHGARLVITLPLNGHR